MVSIQNRGSGGGNSDSELASISENGRFVVFQSYSTNLVASDTNSTSDVFVRDLETGITTLVSINQAHTASANGPSTNPVISADGRFIAFESRASDLVANDNNNRSDIFVRDMQSGTTTLVSINMAGTNGGNGDSIKPFISANGRVVSFQSGASDLAANDNNLTDDVFARDLTTGVTFLISINSAGTGSGNGASFRSGRGTSDGFFRPVLSADGRVVVFESSATDLTTVSDTNGKTDVFARNLQTATTSLISINTAGASSGNRESFHPTISANGQVVAFETYATNLIQNDTNDRPDLLARNLQTGTTVAVNLNTSGQISNTAGTAENPDLSADGRYVAFQSSGSDLVAKDTNGGAPFMFTDVFVRDLQTNTTTLVSVNSAGTDSGNDVSYQPAISKDGRYVAFRSSARDLVSDVAKPVNSGDIYVRDMQSGTTKMLSVNRTGDTSATGDSRFPGISGDGRFVVFESTGFDLVAFDTNDRRDIFAVAVNGQIRFTTDTFNVNENGGTAIITVTRNSNSTGPVTVNYATRGGSATSGSDYAPVSGTLTFAPGETAKSITVPVFDDNTDEANETVNLFLSDTAGVPGSLSMTVLSIGDDDPPPSISVSDASVTEGNSDAFDALFTVTLSAPSEQTIKVDLSSANGTAVAFSDFSLNSSSVTFNPGETSKTFSVRINGDITFEDDETFTINLSNPSNAIIADGQALGTIRNDDPLPAVFINNLVAMEGNSGTLNVGFFVYLSNPSSKQITVQYTTADATATAGTDYAATSGTLIFPPEQTASNIVVPIMGDTLNEASEAFLVKLSNPVNVAIGDAQGLGIINNDDSPALIQFSSPVYTADEDGAGIATITVVRSGDTTSEVTVDYFTGDISASNRSDYTLTMGTLRFAAGELSKTFNVFITNDVYPEPQERVLLLLSNPNGANGASLGNIALAQLFINSDDPSSPTPANNPIDDAQFFVRQHYRDFLNREPDASGLAFWTGQITECGANVGCREVRRINVSAAFFLSIEFQETGYLVYRLHQAAYNTGPLLRFGDFLSDSQEISRGVIVGEGNWKEQLEANKQAFFKAFVERPQFLDAYPRTMSPAQFVDALNANTGGALTQTQRDALVADLQSNAKTRADVIRAIAENPTFTGREVNRAFVYMQYAGYLRRGPYDLPDYSLAGYNFWLNKLNQFGGNYITAEMVKAFITSGEYRQRFGQN